MALMKGAKRMRRPRRNHSVAFEAKVPWPPPRVTRRWPSCRSGSICTRTRLRFNRTYREEVLSAYLFDSLDEVREITGQWIARYNEIRRHDVLGSLPAARYRERLLAVETLV
jgi:transposase InsO family protein